MHTRYYAFPCYLQLLQESDRKQPRKNGVMDCRNSRTANSVIFFSIWLKFKLIYACILVIANCKFKEDPLKIEGAKVVTTFLPYIIVSQWRFFRRSRAAKSAVRGWIWRKFGLIQALMAVLLTCKNDEDPIKNESAKEWYQHYT